MDGEEEMKFYKSDLFLKIVSLLASVIIWFYVVYQENPAIDRWMMNVPVAQKNFSQDFSNGELIVSGVSVDDVDIKISGRRRLIASVNESSCEAYIDMSGITDAGEYEVPVNVKFHIDGVEVVQIRPNRCKIIVDRVVTEERPIIVNNFGTVADGYVFDKNTIEPSTIKLTGPRNELSKIASCKINVDMNGLSQNIEGIKYRVKFYDHNGEEIPEPYMFKLNVEYTDLTCEIVKKKSVRLKVAVNSQVNSCGETVMAEGITSTVELKGEAEIIDKLNEVYTEVIDVSNVYETTDIKYALRLPEGVSVINSDDNTVGVKLTVIK